MTIHVGPLISEFDNALTQDQFEAMVNAEAKHDIASAHLAFSNAYTGPVTLYPYAISTETSDSKPIFTTEAADSVGTRSPEEAGRELKDLLNKLPSEDRKALDTLNQQQKEKFEKLGVAIQANTEKRVKGILGQPGGISLEEFESGVRSDAERDINDYAERRNKIADKIIELGRKNPSQENLSLLSAVSRGISAFFTTVWNYVVTFLGELFAKIAEWLTEAWNKVKKFFQDVMDWFRSIF